MKTESCIINKNETMIPAESGEPAKQGDHRYLSGGTVKRMNKRKYAVIAAALLLAAGCACFTGCDSQGGGTETVSQEVLQANAAAKFTGYTIVRPDSAGGGTVDAAVALRKALIDLGLELEMTTDWVNRGEEMPVGTQEILIGNTNRPETAVYAGTLRKDEFAVAKEGVRYVITGGSDEAVAMACEWFLANVVPYTGEGMSADGEQYVKTHTYPVENPQIAGTPLQEYVIVYTEEKANESEHAAALQQIILERTGWTLNIKRVSLPDVEKYAKRILLKMDTGMEEGYRIAVEDGQLSLKGSDSIQFQCALQMWKAELEEGNMTYDNGVIMEGKITKQPLTLYADASAAAGGNGTEAAPFATGDEIIAGVMKAVLSAPYDITVQMKAGDYLLSETMTLDAQGLGMLGSTVHFVCDDKEEARFCAWVPVTGFAETTVNGHTVWAAALPKVREGEVLYPNQCFTADGVRLERPRYPQNSELEAGLYGRSIDEVAWNDSMDKLTYEDETIETFTRPEDIQIHLFHYWNDERLEIAEINTDENVITTKAVSSIAFIEYNRGAPYYLDNVYEMLGTAERQFYVDKTAGKLYYVPAADDKLDGFTLYASDIDVILNIDGIHGSEEVPAVTFRNIGFTGSDWKTTTRGSFQAASDIHGAVRLNNASHISFEDCSFTHIGDYALEMKENVSYVTVSHCRFADLGAGGVTIFGVNAEEGANHHLTIEDNYIGQYGRIHTNAIGIVLRYAYDCSLSHNEINDGFYTGISVGWSWGYNEHITKNILVEKNHIYNIGQFMLSDMGAIYTLGLQPGTVLRGNLVHNVYSRTSKAWGLYTDEGSSDILIENNISYDVKSEAFHQHYGKDNIVRNNILAFGRDGIVMVSRLEEHNAIHLERNILLSDGAPIYLQHPNNMRMTDDSNLVWDMAGEVFCTGERIPVKQMQAMGLFKNALVADPGFADPENGDFTLPENSPAYDIGFQPIDMSDVGIRE